MIEVTSTSQLKNLLEENKSTTLFLFKHSTRCPVSAMAFAEFERFSASHPDVNCAFVKLIQNRDVSDLITELTGVTHQSPQIFLFDKGELVWNASHSDIQEESMADRLPSDT